MMALAAAGVTALLAGGGVAVAQAAGGPSGTAVVQQTPVHHPGDPCDGHHTRARQATWVVHAPLRHDVGHGSRGQARDRARDRTCDLDHSARDQRSRARNGMTAPAHHGDDHGQHHGQDGSDG